MADMLTVEVALALPDKQYLLDVQVAEGSNVAEVIESSGIAERCPAFDSRACAVGIWGRIVARDAQVADGDRIEMYRPLAMEPREARRRLAAAGGTMGASD